MAKTASPPGGGAAAAKRKAAPGEAGKPGPKRPRKDAKAPVKQPVKLLSKREQKDARKEKKLALKKNYGTIADSVVLWEELRLKSTTKEAKAALVDQILAKVKGNVVGLANHHSGSRVIQWCLKDGSPAARASLLGEVRTQVVTLAKSKYGRFVIARLITIADKAEVPDLVKLFRGHVAELLRHPHGTDVLDDLYNVAPTSCRNALCAELYGREFALFSVGGVTAQGEDIAALGQLLGAVDAGKRSAVLQSLYRGLAPVVEKALLHPAMAHRLLRELLTEAPGSIVADVVDTLAATGGNALKLVHTHDGAAAAAMALAYGTPKDRKRLVKAMKGYVWQTAENEWGHAVVATALSVVDDTSLTGKVILGELKDKLQELVTNKHAHRVLMQLLCPDSHRYLPPATYELLHPPPKTIMAPAAGKGAAVDDDDEELDAAAAAAANGDDDAAAAAAGSEDEAAAAASDGVDADAAGGQQQDGSGEQAKLVPRQLGESKKAADVRRRELLGSGPGSLSGGLVQLCAEQAPQLLASPVGSEVLVEVARGAGGGLLWQLQQDGVRAVHEALVQHIQQELASGSSGAPAAAAAAKQQPGKKKGGKAQQAPADAGAGDDASVAEPLLTHYFASRALRRLLLAGDSEGDEGAGARAFAEQLWSQALQGHCKQLVGSHAEKVLAALLHCGVPGVVQAAAAELQTLVGGGDTSAWAAKFVGPAAAGGGAGGAGGGKRKQQQRPAKEQQSQQQQPKQKRGKKA